MGILVGSGTRAIVQGITGKQGSYQAKLMREYGTKIVAGVVPGKGGATVYDIPVFDTVKEAADVYTPNASIIFVPAQFAADAVLEALDSKIKTVVVITEHLPIKDSISMLSEAAKAKATVIGPNTPGVITPDECKLGIMPADAFSRGNIGVASRSGTLTYEIASQLKANGFGQSTCVGVGGDPVVGLNFIDALELFKADSSTKAVVLIGEIGGTMEEDAAKYISETHYPKPVVAYVAGRFAPAGKRVGHAGAIIVGKQGTAQSKIEAFEQEGVKVAQVPSEVAALLRAHHS